MSRSLKIAYAALVYLFLYLPLAVMVVYSFNASRFSMQWKGFTLHWYDTLIHDASLIQAALHSLAEKVLIRFPEPLDATKVTTLEKVADLRLPAPFAADLRDHRAHAALLDMAFGSGIRLLGGDALFVPAGCEEVVVYGRVPDAVTSHVRVRSHDEHARLAVLDVTVATPSGIVVLELRGLQLFGVKGQFGSAAKARPGVASPARPVAVASAGTAVPRIRAILPRGITAAEGLRGLERALHTNSSQVVVSAMDPARVAACARSWLRALNASNAARLRSNLSFISSDDGPCAISPPS